MTSFENKHYLSIDQGTTGTTVALTRASSMTPVAFEGQEFPQIYPSPGLVEHNLDDIWSSVQTLVKKILKDHSLTGHEILGIGITNQRETVCAFHKQTKAPLSHALVWQDRRGSSFCQTNQDKAAWLKTKTGLPLDPYFSATKMAWLLEHCGPAIQAKKEQQLALGTMDTYLLYKLTDGISFKTEASNASRTLLMNIHTGVWDQELLDFFQIPLQCLPSIEDSFGHFGVTKNLSFLPDGIPITGILGDQQSALIGQGGHAEGAAKCTYGTGAFMLKNTGTTAKESKHGLLTTIAYQHQGQRIYALEGSTYIAGAAVSWLRDKLKIIHAASEVEAKALEVQSFEQEMEHLYFFPFFTGIGTPYWKPEAKACIIGMTRDTADTHFCFAALEAIAQSVQDLIETFKKDDGVDLKGLHVDGGACKNELLMILQASFHTHQTNPFEIIIPEIIETTSYGATLAAAIGLGHISFMDLEKFCKRKKSILPSSRYQNYLEKKRSGWSALIKKLF